MADPRLAAGGCGARRVMISLARAMLTSISRSQAQQGLRRVTSGRLPISSAIPSPPVATVASTGMPRSLARRRRSTVTPRCGFVVHVERQHHRHAEFGEQRGPGCGVRAGFLGITDLDQAARFSSSRARIVARSSSLRARPEAPGVSSSIASRSKRALARVTSTVVPG